MYLNKKIFKLATVFHSNKLNLYSEQFCQQKEYYWSYFIENTEHIDLKNKA